MNSRFVQYSAVVSLLAAAAFAPTAFAQHKCDNPVGMIDKRACAEAVEGPDALRRFVTRTQSIWQLDIRDYLRPEKPSATAIATAKPAPRDAAAGSEQKVATESP